MVAMNLLWFVLSIPSLVVLTVIVSAIGHSLTFGFGIAFLLMIGPNPASAGIQVYARQLIREERVEFGLFWQGLRDYWKKSAILMLVSVAGATMLAINIGFYAALPGALKYVAILWLYGLYFWLSIQLFVQGLLVEQENKSLKLIYRNALILAIDSPVTTLIFFVILTAFSILSVGISLLVALIAGAVIAIAEMRLVHTYLEKFSVRAAR